MAHERDCRDVHLETQKDADYSQVRLALEFFQKYGCNYLGFKGIER